MGSAGDPDVLGRVAANGAVLGRIGEGAQPASGGVGLWSPDGWLMRTHPDLSEALEACAPDDLRVVLGVSTLVTDDDAIYAVGWGTSGVWLRVPSGPALDDAVAADDVDQVDELADWIALRAWRDDLATWIRASRALTTEMVRG